MPVAPSPNPPASATVPTGDDPPCSIERSLRVLGERWTLLILREVFSGKRRFSEIRAALDIAPNLLSARLGMLVGAGVLAPQPYRDAGRRTREQYVLTEAGRELVVILAALQQWGDVHVPRPAGPCALRRSRATGAPVRVGLLDEHGREVPAEDLVFVLADRSGRTTDDSAAAPAPGE